MAARLTAEAIVAVMVEAVMAAATSVGLPDPATSINSFWRNAGPASLLAELHRIG
jgi:hypothetical protein